MKAKEPQQILFDYPKPKRAADWIPGISMYWCSVDKQCDNIGVMPYLMPDKKTAVYATDEPVMLQFDREDLSTGGFFNFEDTTNYKRPTLGSTHIVDDINTNDAIGVLTDMEVGITGPKYWISFYRVTGDAVKQRVPIGRFETKHMNYYHAFGHTADQLIFPEIPVTFDTAGMMMG